MVGTFRKKKGKHGASERRGSHGGRQDNRRPRGALGKVLKPGSLKFDQR